jgi:hypothetical protein
MIPCCFVLGSLRSKLSGPPPIEGIDGGPLPGHPISRVRDHDVGRVTDRNSSASGCRSGRESEDGAGHKRADGANRENGGSEDVSPNAHDCLHAFTEVTAQTLVRRPESDVFVRSPVFG